MAVFLGKLFKTVLQANNGMEGLESFQYDKPDIIISDIDMPEMNGHEMVQAIKKIDPDANIIIYSAYTDSENLLKSIHLGVVDFIPKPVDIDLFEKVLTKVVTKNENKQQPVIVQSEEKDKLLNKQEQEEIFKHLEIIKKSHQTIEFVNHYKGVPIYDKGTIISISFDSITVEVPFLQSRAIKNEGKVVLISELFSHTMEAVLEKFNGYNNTIVLNNIQYLKDKTQRRKVVCVEPNNDFSCDLTFQNIPITSSVILLSSDFITLQLELEKEIKLVEGNELDLQLQIHQQTDTKHIVEITLDLKGELYVMEEIDDRYIKVMLLLEIEKNQKDILDEYITERRKELIIEFKQIKD